MNDFPIKIIKAKNGYDAFVPELPGCIASGPDKETVRRLIEEKIAYYLTQPMDSKGKNGSTRT